MRLTTKGRYAVTVMMDLAIHDLHGPVALTDIAANQGISLSYLEQLFAKLRRNGLVSSTRGPGGGYELARPVEAISVAEIIGAVGDVDSAAPSYAMWTLSRTIRDSASLTSAFEAGTDGLLGRNGGHGLSLGRKPILPRGNSLRLTCS